MVNTKSVCPIFLVGAERSGTTLLRLMLDHHPDLAFNPEFEFAVDQIDNAGKIPNLSDYHYYLSSHGIFNSYNFTIDKNLSYEELINSFLLQKQQSDNKNLVGATVHHKFDHLLKFWKKSKYIHIVRDGRDVSISNIVMKWSGNLFIAANRWIDAENIWAEMEQKLAPEQKLTIYYEDLIRDSEKTLTTICDFIGIPFSKEMYNYADDCTYSLPNTKFVTKWPKKLTDKEIQQIEYKIASLLKQHNYKLSGLPLQKPSNWFIMRMQIHDRIARMLFRIQCYPLGLYIQDVISRRLPFKSWRKKVKLKVWEYNKRFLKN
ncbi:MAG: sulfotransferase [Candidatus Marithrix sp.]|nr:sulfotransferase [Candidatus Marithrix sp.]